MEDSTDLVPTMPYALATPQHRLGGRAIGAIVSCFLTPFISIPWNWLAWGRSQTPGMNSLKLRIYSTNSGMPVTREKMLQRQIGIPLGYCIVPGIYMALGEGIVSRSSHIGLGQFFYILGECMLLGIFLIDILWMHKGDKRQRLRDVLAHTVVLNECIPTDTQLEPNDT